MAASREADERLPERSGSGWIDVHHHCYHADVITALRESGLTQMTPGIPLPQWTVADSLHVMDNTGLSAAILSTVLPGLKFIVAHSGGALP